MSQTWTWSASILRKQRKVGELRGSGEKPLLARWGTKTRLISCLSAVVRPIQTSLVPPEEPILCDKDFGGEPFDGFCSLQNDVRTVGILLEREFDRLFL